MSKIHVIIPVYNAKKFLREAVDSVLNQPYKGIDIVLVNDGSTDGSAQLCDEMAEQESRIYVIHQANAGVSAARNAGIEFVLKRSVKGDYIAFLDADDLWNKNTITDVIEEYYEDVIGFSIVLANASVTRYRPMWIAEDYVTQRNAENTSWFANGSFASHFYSVKMILEYSLRFMNDVKANEDVIFQQQAGFCCHCVRYISRVLYIYRMNPYSATHNMKCVLPHAAHTPSAWGSAAMWGYSHTHISERGGYEWERFCQKIAGARMLEAARGLAENGSGYKVMHDFLFSSDYAYLFRNIDVDYLADWQKSDFNLLEKNCRLFYYKYMIIGSLIKGLKIMLRIPVVRKIREWRTYPLIQLP